MQVDQYQPKVITVYLKIGGREGGKGGLNVFEAFPTNIPSQIAAKQSITKIFQVLSNSFNA